MVKLTTFFDVYKQMESEGLEVDTNYAKSENSKKLLVELSDDDILKELDKLFIGISTIEDYRILINVITDIKASLTVRVLYALFQALISVEERVWASAGMHPPIQDIVISHLDMLLDRYADFALALETELIDWTKKNGYFTDKVAYAFIKQRNEIYADYVVLAGSIINVFDN